MRKLVVGFRDKVEHKQLYIGKVICMTQDRQEDSAERFNVCSYGEGRTGGGQVVSFVCPPESVEEVKKFLLQHVKEVDIPVTGRVNIGHGSYGEYTRYDAVQHIYGGGGPGEGGGWCYREVLEIKNPPEGRCGIVLHQCTSREGSAFTEWETIKDVKKAFKIVSYGTAEQYEKLAGFKRWVICGVLKPWFYAIGDEQLVGDCAFPRGLHDDPVYRFGKKFVVYNKEGIPSVKTCMGARFVPRKKMNQCVYDQPDWTAPKWDQYYYRFVYWDDGSIWSEGVSSAKLPRPLEESELWITEAVHRFKELLAGQTKEFAIEFADGNKFVGKFVKTDPKAACAEGSYCARVKVKGSKEADEGWLDFKPTAEDPNVIRYITHRLKELGKEVEYIEITESRVKIKGKKWAGVYFQKPSL